MVKTANFARFVFTTIFKKEKKKCSQFQASWIEKQDVGGLSSRKLEILSQKRLKSSSSPTLTGTTVLLTSFPGKCQPLPKDLLAHDEIVLFLSFFLKF